MPADTTKNPTGSRKDAATAAFSGVAPEPGSAKPDPILVADGVQRTFGGLKAVDVAHVEIQRGAIKRIVTKNAAARRVSRLSARIKAMA